jgi:hypothetical protein
MITKKICGRHLWLLRRMKMIKVTTNLNSQNVKPFLSRLGRSLISFSETEIPTSTGEEPKKDNRLLNPKVDMDTFTFNNN